jgi:hypothetical protein
MNYDISHVLADWRYEDKAGLQVRRVEGRDGKPRIQVRVDLGLIQMETTGRPDGVRPFGRETLFHHYQEEAERHRARYGWYEGFELDSDQCAGLRQEALQYYHRRIAAMALQDFPAVVADATHNLRILDLLKAFARNREDWLSSEQYRAFITSHRIQATALQSLQQENVQGAILALDRGMSELREIFAAQEREEDFPDSVEVAILQDLRRKLEARHQVSHRRRLEMLLDNALMREDPDQAAELRAQLRRLETDG